MRFCDLRVVTVVGFAFFIDYLIYGLVIPLTPYSSAGVGDGAGLGLLYTGYSAGVLAGTPLFGYLADRIGYRWVMIAGVVLAALTVTLFGLAPNFAVMLVGRFLQGAAAAATWTAGLSLVALHYPTKRAEMMGFALMGSTGGSLLGPVLGGGLYEIGGYGLPFLVAGGLVAVDAALRVFVLPRDKSSGEPGADWRGLLLDRSVLVAGGAVALAAIGWGIIEPLLPVEMGRSGASPVAVGMIFTIGSIAYGFSAPLVGRASDRLPIRKVIAGGTVAMALTLPLLSVLPGVVGGALGLCLVSVCYAFMLNPTSAELGNAVDRRGLSCYGAVYAVYNIAYAIGQMAASSFASAASLHLSFRQILLCVSGTMLVFSPLLLLKDAAAQASDAATKPAALPEPSLKRSTFG